MVNLKTPTWVASSDEVLALDGAEFKRCDQAIDALASETKDDVVERQYSLSKEWGRVVRAKLVGEKRGRQTKLLINSWSVDGSTVQIAMKFQDE